MMNVFKKKMKDRKESKKSVAQIIIADKDKEQMDEAIKAEAIVKEIESIPEVVKGSVVVQPKVEVQPKLTGRLANRAARNKLKPKIHARGRQ